jgi:transcriptional regulator with XRE-family HTH domain
MNDRELRRLLGLNMKKYRNFHRMTQEKLAGKLDISIPFLSDMENGKKWASAHTVAKNADALNIEVYELFKLENTLPNNDSDIIEKYTNEAKTAITQFLDNIRNSYVTQIENKS